MLIEHLPTDASTTGAVSGADPGWSSRDELLLSLLNQLILQRRMWASEKDAQQLVPVRMPWHQAKAKPATPDEVRAFFGRRTQVIREAGST